MITYVIGDIHGKLDNLVGLYEKIKADAWNQEHRIICLGDYIDRGPDSKGVVDFLMKNKRENDVYLMGNHEDMLLANLEDYYNDSLQRQQLAGAFFQNGGMQTMQSYGLSDMHDIELPEDHIEFYKSLKLSFEDEHRYYVHAGVSYWNPLSEQRRFDQLWIRDQFLRYPDKFEKYVVHGHTPVMYDPRQNNSGYLPVVLDNRCNVDTGCVFGGKLTAAVFDDKHVDPIWFIYN